MGKNPPGLQVISIEGRFLDSAATSVEEYDYLEPDHKYRLLPKAKVQLSTLDGKKTYVAIGPGILILDSKGSVSLNGKALKPKDQQSLLHNVTATKIPSHELAGLPLRGIQVVVRTPEGEKIPLYRNSYALVVGNGNYTRGWDPLPGAIRDVKDVAKALEKHGFEVTLKADLTRDAFNRAFWKFSHKYGKSKDDRLLFYYAGHGYTQEMATGDDLGYLVMVDAPVPEKDPMGFNLASVDMQTIVTQAKMIKARHVLFMFDSCFSGSILNLRERVVPESISNSVSLPVRQFITAGRANEPVPDHSIFKQAFLDLIEGRDKEPIPDGYITGEELGLYLKNKVPEYNPTQHPQYGKIKDIRLDKGDFVFVLKSQRATPSLYDRLQEERERLERENRELERLKAEIERKRLETERKRLEVDKKRTLFERRALERQVVLLAKEREKIEKLAAVRTKEYEAKLAISKQDLLNATEKGKSFEEYKKRALSEKNELEREVALLEKEAEKQKALEKESERLKRQREKAARQALAAKAPAKEKPRTVVSSAPPREIKAAKQPVKKETPSIKEVKTAKTTPSDSMKKMKTMPQKEQKIASLHVPKVKPQQDLATLIVTSNIRNAKVYIDKKEVSFWASPNEAWIYRGGVPFKSQEIDPGRHVIRVHEDGYEEEVKIVDVSPGEVLELDVTLFKSLSDSGDEDHGGGGGGGGGGGSM